MATVSVTPMTVERAAVVPNIDSPTPMEGSTMYHVMAPTFPANRPEFKAWRPGRRSAAEFKIPCTAY